MKKFIIVLISLNIMSSCNNSESGKSKVGNTKQEMEAAVLKAAAPEMARIRVEVDKIAHQFEMAKRGLISKESVLESWNEGVGSVIGQANTIEKAEKLYLEKKKAYLEMMYAKAQSEAAFLLARKTMEDSIQMEAEEKNK